MALNMPANPLTPVFLYKVLQERPDRSKMGFRQQYVWERFFPWEDFVYRDLLLEQTLTENNLAGLYAPDGQALPVGDELFRRMMLTLQDIKSTRHISPNIVQKIREAGELSMLNASSSQASKATRAAIAREITGKMGKCEDDVDTTLEYLAMGALQYSIVWPPVDADGSAISSPPAHWNAGFKGTWSFQKNAIQSQDVTALVDKDGNNPGSDVRKYWTDSSADILGQFRTLKQAALENLAISLEGATVLMATSTKDLLLSNTAMINWLAGSNKEQPGARTYISDNEFHSFIGTNLGLNFVTYDSFWTYQAHTLGSASTRSHVRMLPASKIIIIPPMFNGTAKMGTAHLEGQDENWKPGKMPWSYKDPKPNYNREVGVNAIAWPTFVEEPVHFVLQVTA